MTKHVWIRTTGGIRDRCVTSATGVLTFRDYWVECSRCGSQCFASETMTPAEDQPLEDCDEAAARSVTES